MCVSLSLPLSFSSDVCVCGSYYEAFSLCSTIILVMICTFYEPPFLLGKEKSHDGRRRGCWGLHVAAICGDWKCRLLFGANELTTSLLNMGVENAYTAITGSKRCERGRMIKVNPKRKTESSFPPSLSLAGLGIRGADWSKVNLIYWMQHRALSQMEVINVVCSHIHTHIRLFV